MANPGYRDTPIIEGTSWHVHDGERPQPPTVTAGTESSAEVPGRPPSDAVVLFDGSDLSEWMDGDGGDARWDVMDGSMQVVPGTGDITSRQHMGDCQIHLEWAVPAEIKGESQGRGNSGVFVMDRYEIQVLDSYANPTYADGAVGGVYGQFPPMVIASRLPGHWQSYDIVWIAPRFDGVHLVSPACLSLFHNGVVVHHHRALLGPTGHRDVYHYVAHPPEAPLRLQDHGDLVRYRNIWFRPLDEES